MSQKQNSKLPQKYQEWIDARKRHRLSHAHIQMARELGFLPKSLRKIDDNQNKPWKAPLSDYIEDLYFKRFKRERPETVITIEEMAKRYEDKKAVRKALRAEALKQSATEKVSSPEASSDPNPSDIDE